MTRSYKYTKPETRNRYGVCRFWSTEEKDFVEEWYGTMTAKELSAKLLEKFGHSRTPKAIAVIASKLDVLGRLDVWTNKEEQVVKDMYANSRMADIMKKLPGRSMRAIHVRAQKLGIKRPPAGHPARVYNPDSAWQIKKAKQARRAARRNGTTEHASDAG